MNLVGYHGTSDDGKKKILSNGVKIPKCHVGQVTFPDRKIKIPGSLGFGFYIFKENEDLALKFANKFLANPVALNIEIDIQENEFLQLDVLGDRNMYHEFRETYIKNARNLYKKINGNNHRYNIKQHVFDGIVMEAMIKHYANERNVYIKAISLSTYTPIDKEEPINEFSFVPNGVEICIKDSCMIKILE